jgi:hypothetical protein
MNKISGNDNVHGPDLLEQRLGGWAAFLRENDPPAGWNVAAYTGLGQAFQCACLGFLNHEIRVFNNVFATGDDNVRGTAIHELGHVMDFNSVQGYKALSNAIGIAPYNVGTYGTGNGSAEYYAELVSLWVYKQPGGQSAYMGVNGDATGNPFPAGLNQVLSCQLSGICPP